MIWLSCNPARWLVEDVRSAPSADRAVSCYRAEGRAVWIGRRAVIWGGFGKGPGTIELAAAIMVGAGGAEVSATPLTPFRYEAQAQRHCPHDQVVWLDFRKGVYYGKSQKRYGQGFDGSFVCLSEARGSRYRGSLLGLR
jgi:hypothetical protein